MLPVWLSDLRGAAVALAVAAILHWSVCHCYLLLCSLCVVNAIGFVCSVAFYVHTTRVVFNRRVSWKPSCFWQHLMMTRPLEIVWRFLTVPFRTLPDFHILGETRTGTTSLAAHLRNLGCIGPFSPWIVPLASDKESFYFVGHYWGIVNPDLYRMCFPLKPTLWLRQLLTPGRVRPPVFDACASHLNAPWAAPLIRRATPDAALIVLVRQPVEQNSSWWRLEMGAHGWARSMGMTEDFLIKDYPPLSFKKAVTLSESDAVRSLYKESELAAAKMLSGEDSHTSSYLSRWRLPERFLPFPGGQLAAFAHMGRYIDNIERYLRLYAKGRVLIAETRELCTHDGLDGVVQRLADLVPALGAFRIKAKREDLAQREPLRLNASSTLPLELEPDPEFLVELQGHYREHNNRLFQFMGRDLGWND